MDFFQWLDDFENGTEFVIFGNGENGDIILDYLKKREIKAVAFCDNDEKKQGTQYRDIEVLSLSEVRIKSPAAKYIVSVIEHRDEIAEQLESVGVFEESIFKVENTRVINDLKKELPDLYISEDEIFRYGSMVCRSGTRKFNEIKEMYSKPNIVGGYNKKQYSVSICAIFPNEALYLKEWLEFHKIVGVEHFYLYNNNSNDNYSEVLQPYISAGEVTLVEWPYAQGQVSAYFHCVENYCDESDWIGFIDIDEFVVPIQHDSIYEFLSGFKDVGSVLINWKFFGSAGIVERDISRLVTATFFRSWCKHMNIGKCFYNTAFGFSERNKEKGLPHTIWTVYENRDIPPVDIWHEMCPPGIQRKGEKNFPIQINHYVVKSWAEYKLKMERTDVFFKKNSHTEDAFLYHDRDGVSVDINICKYMDRLLKRMEAKA